VVTGEKCSFFSYRCSQWTEKWKWSWGKPAWQAVPTVCQF